MDERIEAVEVEETAGVEAAAENGHVDVSDLIELHTLLQSIIYHHDATGASSRYKLDLPSNALYRFICRM